MPATPELWRDDYQVNINPSGVQADPVITQLASGYILVVWTDWDDSSTPGSPAGPDVIGRIFNPLGDLATSEFRLNTFSSVDTEFDPSITALADGGFMVTYDRGGQFNDLFYETYSFNSATGTVAHQEDGFIHFGSAESDGKDAVVASTSASSTMTAFVAWDGGAEELFIRAYNPAADVMSEPIAKTDTIVGGISWPDICALSNGTYAVAYTSSTPFSAGVYFQIVDTAGTTLFAGEATGSGGSSSIARLTGGGFALAWQDGADLRFRVYNNSGVAQIPLATIGLPTVANEQGAPDVAGLAGGGFVIVWADRTLNQLRGQRYDSDGAIIGAEFIVEQLTDAGADEAAPQIESFSDGRFAVTWDDGADVRIKYFDIRDTVSASGYYTPDKWQVGTAGNDTMGVIGSTEFVHGWDGNDTIFGSNSADDIRGDAGNDTLTGNGADDRLTGGAGNDFLQGGAGADILNGGGAFIFATESDTASYAGSNAGVTVNLASGSGIGGHAQGDTLSGIEHLIGSGFNDTLIGNGSANTLDGGAGSDILNGSGGADTLRGNTGADAMAGGSGNDLYFVDNAADTITESSGQGSDIVYTSVSYKLAAGREIELFATTSQAGTGAMTLTGNEFAQRINGNNGNNVIYGGAGNDLLVGYGGNDNIEGQNGADTLKGVSGADKFVFRYSTIATSGADHVSDFGADDAIYVDHPSVSGPLNPAAFVAGANALDANDRFIYYAPYDALYFDQDGVGGAAKVLMAVFDNGYVPTAADIILF